MNRSRVLIPLAMVAAVLFMCGCTKRDTDKNGGGAGGGANGPLSIFDKTFEGDIVMTTTKAGQAGKSFTIELKSPKLRVEAPPEPNDPMTSGGLSLILDVPQKKAYALVHAQKKALVLGFDRLKSANVPGLPASADAPGRGSPGGEKPTVEKTGKTDGVAGYSCEIWKITYKDGRRADACLAEGIKWFDLTDFGLQSPEVAAAAALSDMNHFPLRLVMYDAKGTETARMQATKIDKKALDDSLFTVPPGYAVLDLAELAAHPPKLPQLPPPARKP